jgi:hypothetical protein
MKRKDAIGYQFGPTFDLESGGLNIYLSKDRDDSGRTKICMDSDHGYIQIEMTNSDMHKLAVWASLVEGGEYLCDDNSGIIMGEDEVNDSYCYNSYGAATKSPNGNYHYTSSSSSEESSSSSEEISWSSSSSSDGNYHRTSSSYDYGKRIPADDSITWGQELDRKSHVDPAYYASMVEAKKTTAEELIEMTSEYIKEHVMSNWEWWNDPTFIYKYEDEDKVLSYFIENCDVYFEGLNHSVSLCNFDEGFGKIDRVGFDVWSFAIDKDKELAERDIEKIIREYVG